MVATRINDIAPSHSRWTPSDHVMQLARDHNDATPSLGAERAIHYTEFYKKSTDTPATIKKAKALRDHLTRRTIRIHAGEIIVGSHTEHRIGAICHVELAGIAMLEDIFKFEKRETNPLRVDPAVRRKLVLKVMPYWLMRSLPIRAQPILKRLSFMKELMDSTRFTINEAGGIAHFLPDYASLIETGTEGLRARLEERLEDQTLNQGQKDHLEAGLITLEALEIFSGRYCQEAERLGLSDIAKTLSRVPRKPATNLREALQMIWFFQMIIQIESIDQGISLGRVDQYLNALYLQEVAEGTFDPDGFRDMFSAFCLKLSEVIPLFSERTTEMFAGLPTGQAATLGGIDEAGEDASNELTFLLLDVIDCFKTRQPNWHARWSHKSCDAYTRRLFEVIGRGGGSPALYNDDVIMPALGGRFDAPDKLWNYATVGCVEPALSGISFTSSDAAIFNFARMLENILKRFRSKSAKERLEADAIGSMDDLMAALETELIARIGDLKAGLDVIEKANRDFHPVPFSSLTVQGCIDKAADLTAGGALYNASGIQGVGVADLANSLAAIEAIVFERKEVTLKDLAAACANDFKGQEDLKARLSGTEKFGNNSALVDGYAKEMVALFDRVISENVNKRGGRWMPGFYSMTCHQSMGRRMSALPSGRAGGQPLADGLAPTDGSDCLGPTASLNSVAGMDSSHFPNGINLNIKFDARTMRGEKGAVLLEGLIKGYFDQGGMQVQVNVLDPQVLMEARKSPEKYRNLLVRISGYSAYFVDLTPGMQGEIIEQTRNSTHLRRSTIFDP